MTVAAPAVGYRHVVRGIHVGAAVLQRGDGRVAVNPRSGIGSSAGLSNCGAGPPTLRVVSLVVPGIGKPVETAIVHPLGPRRR